MVKNTRKTISSDDLRPLNLPIPTNVVIDEYELPVAINMNGKWVYVERINDAWQISDEWWRDKPIIRSYFECLTKDTNRVTLFRDIIFDIWYLQKT